MSKVLINQYYTNIQRATQYGKSKNETAIRNHTWNLLNAYAHKKNYEVIPEISCLGTKGKKVFPDGILRNNWGLDIGYWESKDEKDNINDEIDAKIRKGYPLTNILFEDSQNAVLYQYGQEIMRAPVNDPERFDLLLDRFIEYKSETVYKFEKALDNFKVDIPVIIETLRNRIEQTGNTNPEFLRARETFLELCKTVINPEITLDDIREMMIQHILTSDIFNIIFDEQEFHRHNSVARELENLIGTLFSYSERRNLLNSIQHFYEAINATAASITDHHEKQKFLKVLYENFYKVYNPKAADRLGVVYTPQEIVRFMVQGTDYLLEKHFGKTLADEGVEILDPAVGTGTFICDIIEHLPEQHLKSKYKNELHANEVAILPFYIANLNIEYTFKQKMGYYEEFPNLCFVDTLDNTGGLSYKGQQHSLFGLSSENAERINRQNQKKISVIIGNPPYNAKQENYNSENPNRLYASIDKRIKDTYVKYGSAQNQNTLYDMFVRFLRWASDRIATDGIITFVSNNSFIDSKTFDGFRKCIQKEFSDIYIVNLKGNARNSGERRRMEAGNIFSDEIKVGIAVYFLIKAEGKTDFNIYYNEIEDYKKSPEKKEYLKDHGLKDLKLTQLLPDLRNNWINQTDNDFDELLPLIDKDVKAGQHDGSIFKVFTNGLKSQRDEWVYDLSRNALGVKMRFFTEVYENTLNEKGNKDKFSIKWDRELGKYLERGIRKSFDENSVVESLYRPFYKMNLYFDKHFNGMTYQWPKLYTPSIKNKSVAFNGLGMDRPFAAIASDGICDVQLMPNGQIISLNTFDAEANPVSNLTDWGLFQFQNRYPGEIITKEDIFHYVYAVLHNPVYRKNYEQNLKREFPRIPFYDDFRKWAEWGKELMDLHINFETVEPYALELIEKPTEKSPAEVQKEMFLEVAEPEQMFSYQPKIKVKLKAFKETGTIELDEITDINGIPSEAWEYKLGNRSALEWILDQYKEKKPSDPTIAEKFNTYRFADYKEKVIDLLKRVCTVSVETMKIIREMKETN
jgi:predicted helicase